MGREIRVCRQIDFEGPRAGGPQGLALTLFLLAQVQKKEIKKGKAFPDSKARMRANLHYGRQSRRRLVVD